jgi:hypothetical protein
MSAPADLLPAYLEVSRFETGRTLGLDHQTYRCLCYTALGIIEGVPGRFMGIYRQPGRGAVLDIWSASKLLIICTDPSANRLELFLCPDLDSPSDPACIVSISNSKEDWKRLGRIARNEITKVT